MKIQLYILSALMVLVSSFDVVAQNPVCDRVKDGLKGEPYSVLVTMRGAHNQIISQPTRYRYNEDGNCVQTVYYDTAGMVVITVDYTYDKKGRLIQDTRTHNPFGMLLAVTKYSYDKKNRQVCGEVLAITDDTLCDHLTNSYDKEGNMVESILKDHEGHLVNKAKHTYDGQHHLLSSTYFTGDLNIYQGEEFMRYDTDGNLVEQRSLTLQRITRVILYTYDFDDHGNWVKRYAYHVTPHSADLLHVATRDIVYESAEN